MRSSKSKLHLSANLTFHVKSLIHQIAGFSIVSHSHPIQTIAGYEIEVEFSSLGNLEKIDRAIGALLPFTQQGLEADATAVSLKINGESIAFDLLPMGITGGASAVWSPCGIYAR